MTSNLAFKRIAFLFPGQGAQYPGMVKDFANNFEIARRTLEECDDLLHYSLSDLILNGPQEKLTQTRHSQLAIYTTGIAILRVIQEMCEIQPFVCGGLSLGEYTALTAAKWLHFSEALSLVQRRGEFMNSACEATPGMMAVVIGLEGEIVEKTVEKLNLPNDLWVANFNCPGQVVLSGTAKGVALGTEAMKAAGAKRVLPLQVHGAFHSGLMHQAELELTPYLDQITLTPQPTKLVMNVPGNFVSTKAEALQNLIKQVTHPVRWEQGILAMEKAEVDLYLEFGPGQTLSGMNKRIGVKAPTFSIDKIEHLTELLPLLKEGKHQ